MQFPMIFPLVEDLTVTEDVDRTEYRFAIREDNVDAPRNKNTRNFTFHGCNIFLV
jgi:hypothetical protein